MSKLLDDKSVWLHFYHMVEDTCVRVHPTLARELLASNGFEEPKDCAHEPDGKQPRVGRSKGRTKRRPSCATCMDAEDQDEEREESANRRYWMVDLNDVQQTAMDKQIAELGSMLRHTHWDKMRTYKVKCVHPKGKMPEARVVIKSSVGGELQLIRDYIINVRDPFGGGCRFCTNIGDTHSSNRVYFVISRERGTERVLMQQHCYKEEDNSKRSNHGVSCTEYKSRAIKITNATLLEKLYARTNMDNGLQRRGTGSGIKHLLGALRKAHAYLHFPLFSLSAATNLGHSDVTGVGSKGVQQVQEMVGESAADLLERVAHSELSQTLEA